MLTEKLVITIELYDQDIEKSIKDEKFPSIRILFATFIREKTQRHKRFKIKN
jgi:hypothetical protein